MTVVRISVEEGEEKDDERVGQVCAGTDPFLAGGERSAVMRMTVIRFMGGVRGAVTQGMGAGRDRRRRQSRAG